MRRVFVDTGAFFALADKTDRHHKAALTISGGLKARCVPAFTSDLVAAETHSLLTRKLGRDAAREWLDGLSMQLDFGTEHDYTEALEIIARHPALDLSLTDAFSAAMIRRSGVSEVFGFDGHFVSLGFSLIEQDTGGRRH